MLQLNVCLFSKGQLLISHIHNWLSADSMRTLLCLRIWSKSGYVQHGDLKHAASLPDVQRGDQWDGDKDGNFELIT